MAPISPGLGGRRRDGIDPSRIPPGQYYERGFLVLSAGPTPHTPLEEWTIISQHVRIAEHLEREPHVSRRSCVGQHHYDVPADC